MRALAKLGLVGAGYVAAFAIAVAVVAAYIAATSGPDRQTYGAMFAFGDSILFVGVFGVASLAPTGAALFFLRPYRPFWQRLSVVALVVAATAVGASADYLAAALHVWSIFSVPRLLVTPVFTLFFFVAAVVAPTRGARLALFAATGLEAAIFLGLAILWFGPFQPR